MRKVTEKEINELYGKRISMCNDSVKNLLVYEDPVSYVISDGQMNFIYDFGDIAIIMGDNSLGNYHANMELRDWYDEQAKKFRSQGINLMEKRNRNRRLIRAFIEEVMLG